MKTKLLSFKQVLLAVTLVFSGTQIWGQDAKPKLAILPLDAHGMIYSGKELASVLRMETEKLKVANIIDPYEMAEVLKKEKSVNTDSCFSKSCLSRVGQLLGVDQVASGSVERYGNKIVVTLRLYDVKKQDLISADVTEYVNLQEELQRMMRVSVCRLFGVETDKVLVDQLVNIEVPVKTDYAQLKLNGPRFGFSYLMGDAAARMTAPKEEGGYDMYPVSFVLGYQQEFRYQSVGDFQALIELIGTVSGLESGQFIPAFTFMNGFRWGKAGWEFGFGPTLRVVKRAEGFFDTEDYLEAGAGKWHLANEMPYDTVTALPLYNLETQIDRRGTLGLSAGLVLAFGRTFRAGYLNVPVNLYFAPRKQGSYLGVSCGFNISKKNKNL
jgi:hypothetical protein